MVIKLPNEGLQNTLQLVVGELHETTIKPASYKNMSKSLLLTLDDFCSWKEELQAQFT
jgi:hypothetical protein